MGLFGDKKIFVDSVIYNMAGDITERMDYLKTVVASSVINNPNFSISEALSTNYKNGPGMRLRSFHRWAKRAGNYDNIRIPKAFITAAGNYDIDLIKSQIPAAAGQTVKVNNIRYGSADISDWAEQWVLLNHPSSFTTAWKHDYNAVTNVVTITWADATTSTFTPVGFDPTGYYFYVTYTLSTSTTFIGTRYWMYRMGSGNPIMDAQRSRSAFSTAEGEFLPFIPVRIESEFLSNSYNPEIYTDAKRAYKKLTGAKLDDLIEKIADNPSIDDIDHAYIFQGVSLNTKHNYGREYIFRFFDKMRIMQVYTTSDFTTWDDTMSTYWYTVTGYRNKREMYLDDGGIEGDDPVIAENPEIISAKPLHSLDIESEGLFDSRLNLNIRWGTIVKTVGTGLRKAGAKPGDLWWAGATPVNGDKFIVNLTNAILSGQTGDNSYSTLVWQKTDNYWEQLEIRGLNFTNNVYQGKTVEISAFEALVTTPSSEESGFIIPIHYQTYKEMSLVHATQLATFSSILVFNCYKVVKQKWYQTGIFKIALFAVIIAVTIATGGAAAPGLLGAAGAVGASLGFTGLMAVIVGAIANAIAAMIVMRLLSVVSVAAFGEKFGAIVGAVASVIAISVGTSMMNGASLSSAWGNLMNAQNLLQLTSAVGNGIAGYVAASTAEYAQKTQELIDEYNKQSQEITQKYLEQFGIGQAVIDPMMLTDSAGLLSIFEEPQSFLDRTLMCGSDIADMSMDMLNNFAKYTLDINTMGS